MILSEVDFFKSFKSAMGEVKRMVDLGGACHNGWRGGVSRFSCVHTLILTGLFFESDQLLPVFLKGEFTFFFNSRIGCPPLRGVKLDGS